MGRVVYLHVGAPKTGTTYLQDRLDLNRATLRRHGIHFPGGPLGMRSSNAQFRAALDLMGMDWGGPPGHAAGHWDTLAKRVRRLDGTVVVSHEIMASASPEQIARAVTGLGGELHVVFSARDLARQVPAVWQESIKQGRRWTFRRFLGELKDNPDLSFWKAQSVPAVLTRWGHSLPPERVHLVTLPKPGSPPQLLWERFCTVVGIEPRWAPRDSGRANPSMGAPETTLVRRLNRRLRGSDLTAQEQRSLVKEMLVQRNLASRDVSRRVTLPPRMYPWAQEVAHEWAAWVDASGIDVVGDVSELDPAPAPTGGRGWYNPDRPGAKAITEVAMAALVAMTEEAARRTPPDRRLRGRLAKAAGQLRER